AVVMMPSFVPYATVETSSGWLPLAGHGLSPRSLDHTKHETADAMRASRHIKAIQNCSAQVADADCYRDGDLMRLMRRAEQLAARLPLQTMQVQVPYENTLGGFAMFSSGITDLAPELYGWYGEPGIRPDRETTLFLVGDHFSVHQTRVVAGG